MLSYRLPQEKGNMSHSGYRTDAYDERIQLSTKAKTQIDVLGVSETFIRKIVDHWTRESRLPDYAILKARHYPAILKARNLEIRVRRLGRETRRDAAIRDSHSGTIHRR